LQTKFESVSGVSCKNLGSWLWASASHVQTGAVSKQVLYPVYPRRRLCFCLLRSSSVRVPYLRSARRAPYCPEQQASRARVVSQPPALVRTEILAGNAHFLGCEQLPTKNLNEVDSCLADRKMAIRDHEPCGSNSWVTVTPIALACSYC